MTRDLNAEIIAIGTEILLGELTDTNSVYLAKALRDMGINLFFMTSVGDNERRIESAIRIALARADLVITCGGLGPTVDDMTRQAVGMATDRGLTFRQDLLDSIAARFATFRVTMTENNRRQAYVPDNAIIIDNPVGTAPAFAVEVGAKTVISLPGVPREMKFLMTEKVIPYLRMRYALKTEIIKARTLKAAGIGESALDELIGNALLSGSNPTVGLNAHSGQIDIRVTAKAASEEEAEAMIEATAQALMARIGQYVYGVDDVRLEDALAAALRQTGTQIATLEAGVTTDLETRLTETFQGEAWLLPCRHFANVVESATALHLDDSVPLRTLAEDAARALSQGGSRAGLVILSTPDDNMDHADQQARSAVAVSFGDKVLSRAYGFGSSSEAAVSWTVTWTLAMLWRMVSDHGSAH
ncbi:MAG: CinA family nicotinamide mononucleotide deamidase-related protein [Anaerolineae bacterium]|nr:CinA family nicotinamide mononucleotide deamidase-related protein [Anaerolineae bacterium]NUQ02746.1 CinA family nicotinamide mononucleotide deamidase-related protein [Anaerolineae bacterium]